MNSDRTVTPRDVLRALLRVRREGAARTLAELETREADLCEFLLEELTAIHGALVNAGVPPRDARRLYRRIETGALVLVAAQQNAHLPLWRADAAGTRLAQLDPTLSAAASNAPARAAEGNGADDAPLPEP